MIRLLLLATTATLSALGQFTSLATDYDGARLYFTTELSQDDTNQPGHGKAFVADASGVRPLVIHNRDVFPYTGTGPFFNAFTTNFYNLTGISVSSNVGRMAIAGLRECSGFSSATCGYPDQTTVYDARGQVVSTSEGHLALSPNGVWGLATTVRLSAPDTQHRLVNLDTGTAYTISSLSGSRDWQQHDIANNGTVVMAGGSALIVYGAAGPIQTVAVDDTGLVGTGVISATVDAAGLTAVWEEAKPHSRSLRVSRLDSRISPVSLRIAGRNDYRPAISDDGRRILFLSTPAGADDPQVFIMQADGSGRRQITSERKGISKAMLSGSGEVAWVVTRTGRLLQVRISSGFAREIVGPVAAFLRPAYHPGTQVPPALDAGIGQVVSAPASVMPGETIEIDVQGIPAPVLRIKPQSVTFQIPWTLPIPNPDDYATYDVRIRKAGSRLWMGNSMKLWASIFRPAFVFEEGTGFAVAAHENFDALVTAQQPARPGEVVHLYARGFGPVTPPVAAGVPAPAAPLSRISAPFACRARNQSATIEFRAEVLFAGLAPGLIGYYQFDIRLPVGINENTIFIECSAGDNLMRQAGVALAFQP